jgi:hypothetical protein
VKAFVPGKKFKWRAFGRRKEKKYKKFPRLPNPFAPDILLGGNFFWDLLGFDIKLIETHANI